LKPFLCLFGFLFFSTAPGSAREIHPTVVVTTSMLASAVQDAIGSAGDVTILQLVPPGSCPGHFDLSPRSVEDLRNAVAVVRHDYQGALEEQIGALHIENLEVIAVPTGAGLLIPGNYAAFVSEVKNTLSRVLPEIESQREGKSLAERLHDLGEQILEEAKPLKGVRVVASRHQEDFCRWLGLDVVGILNRPEEVTPGELKTLIDTRPDMVVANLQEGTEAAETLGQRLKVPVATLSNFPGAPGYGESYGDVVRSNLQVLIHTWNPR